MAEEKLDKKAQRKAAKEQKKKEKEEKKAKGQGETTEEEEETVGGKLLIGFVAVLIIVVWLAILALLVKMDVGGFGSTVLYPVLKDVPVINKILPETEEYAQEDAAYSYASMDDAVARIKELEKELEEAKSANGENSAHISDLEAQAKELQEYKEAEASFEAEKEKFYEEVVFSDNAPDINEYKAYYESIEPDNAEVLYKQVVQQLQSEEQIKQYAATYSNMKPAQAAAIFNTMTDDLQLVGKILWQMDAKSRGNILGAMNADTAAKVTKLMEP